MFKNDKVNFVRILLNQSTQWVDQAHICAMFSCTKFYELKYKNICLQISTHYNALKFCMHVHTIVNRLYSKEIIEII
jgi:hypothetical protein